MEQQAATTAGQAVLLPHGPPGFLTWAIFVTALLPLLVHRHNTIRTQGCTLSLHLVRLISTLALALKVWHAPDRGVLALFHGPGALVIDALIMASCQVAWKYTAWLCTGKFLCQYLLAFNILGQDHLHSLFWAISHALVLALVHAVRWHVSKATAYEELGPAGVQSCGRPYGTTAILSGHIAPLRASSSKLDSGASSMQDAPMSEACSDPAMDWWQLCTQAWRWTQPKEYDDWVDKQLVGMVHLWARLYSACATVGVFRAYLVGSVPAGVIVITLHNSPYFVISAMSLGVKGLGRWQVWIRFTPLIQSLMYLYISTLPPSMYTIWEITATGGSDFICTGLVAALGEQAPLPYILVCRMLLTYCNYVALRALPQVPHPLAAAIANHLTAVLVATTVRTLQIRAYRKWCHRQVLVAAAASSQLQSSDTSASSLPQKASGFEEKAHPDQDGKSGQGSLLKSTSKRGQVQAPMDRTMSTHKGLGSEGSSTGLLAYVHPSATPPTSTQPTWWQLLAQAWRWTQPKEYDDWVDKQVSVLVLTWARTVIAMGLMCIFKAVGEGSTICEVGCVLLHTTPYIIMCGRSQGLTWLGTWQTWMALSCVGHCLGYLHSALMPVDHLPVWRAAATTGGEVVFSLITAVGQQSSLPFLLLARALLVLCQGWALHNLGYFQHPFRQAAMIQFSAMSVTFAVRVYQLLVYHRWLGTAAKTVLAQQQEPSGLRSSCGATEKPSVLPRSEPGTPVQHSSGTASSNPGTRAAGPRAPNQRHSEPEASLAILGAGRERAAALSSDGRYVSAVNYPTAQSVQRLEQQLTRRRRERKEAADVAAPLLPQRHHRQHKEVMINMKIHNLDPKQLSPSLPALVQERITALIPDAELGGISIRHGCVVVTLDLLRRALSEEGRAVAQLSADGLAQVMSGILRDTGSHQVLTPGSAMEVQTADTVTEYVWDADRGQYQPTPAITPPSGQVSDSSVVQLLQQAAQCHILGTVPAVHCVAADRHQPLVLALQLQLPSHSRLLGWQPADSTAAPEDGVLVAGTETSLAVPLDVRVLVRQQGGAYLPVSVKLSPQEIGPGATHNTCVVEAEAEVSLPGPQPQGLQLQLWCKAPSVQGPELMCAHCPLVVMSEEWRGAATELQEQVTVMRGVQATHVLPLSDRGSGEGVQTNVAVWLESLSTWLSHMSGHVGTSSPLPPSIGAMQTDLLLHMVLYGMTETAQLMVTLMAAASTSTGAAEPQPAAAEWFRQAASGVGAVDGQPQAVKTSLLHAAMESGKPAVLDKVIRWGQLHGGRQWRWPWSLTDEVGCTALHHAASHPEPGVCALLVKTLTRMLPASEVEAARHVWFHGMGSVGVTAAHLSCRMCPTEDVEHVWLISDNDAKPAQQQAHAATGSSGAAGSREVAGTAATAQSESLTPPLQCLSSTAAQPTWRQLLTQAWRWTQPKEYDDWVDKEYSSIIFFWARTLAFLNMVCLAKAYAEGSHRMEWPFVLIHSVPYALMTGASLGVPGLGRWQKWMPVVPLCHSLGYLYSSLLSAASLPAWSAAGLGGGDAVYCAVIVAGCEQNTLPYMLATRCLLVACYSHALRMLGHPSPVLWSLLVHGTALVVATGVRCYQLRSFHRWQHGRAGQGATGAPAAAVGGTAGGRGGSPAKATGLNNSAPGHCNSAPGHCNSALGHCNSAPGHCNSAPGHCNSAQGQDRLGDCSACGKLKVQ